MLQVSNPKAFIRHTRAPVHAIAASVSGPRRSMEAMGGGGGAHMSMSAMVALSSDASRAASDRSMASDSSVGSMIVRPIAGSPQLRAGASPGVFGSESLRRCYACLA